MKPYTFCKKSLLIVLTIASAVAFTSCQKDIPPLFKDNSWKPGKPVVLVAGYESNGINNVAKYWVNGQEEILSDGTNDALANSIFASGNSVYIAGRDGGPVYWKNNIETGLPIKYPDAKTYSSANSIFISGNKVYIAGNDSTRAVYWADSTESILNITDAYGNFDYSTANSVFVTGNDIYVAGSHGPNAVYWKNGVEVYLTNRTTAIAGGVKANSIYVSGGNVYVVGTNVSAGSQFPFVMYWENGADVSGTLDFTLPNSNHGTANSVVLSGNKVYIAGMVITNNSAINNAVYWNNGSETILPGSSINSIANSIYVSGKDVYVAGYEYNNFEEQYAVYWKNGIEAKLTDGTNRAFAKSIFIK